MGTIAGDLTQPPVWDAINAAITKRISGELDKLDTVARSNGSSYAPPTTRQPSA
jgi:hypothetical protein